MAKNDPRSVRLQPAVERLLNQKLKESGQAFSPYVEQLIIAHLSGDKMDNLSDEVSSLKREVLQLRNESSKFAEAILIATGIDADEARQVVDELRGKLST